MISLNNLLNTSEDLLISTRNRDEFNNLMQFLETKEYRWVSGDTPTSQLHLWNTYGTYTIVHIRPRKRISYGNTENYKGYNVKIFKFSELDIGDWHYQIDFEEIY